MRRSVVTLLSAALIAASCGGSDGETSSSETPSEESAPASTPDSEPAASEPPATEPPATDPPATEPAATEPPPTDPPATDPPVTEPPVTEPALDELPLVGLGEYEVGVTTITITDVERNRPLTVDVWFPLPADAIGEPHRYTFVTGDYYESPVAITADPATISTDGPFPMVVYSHGSGGQRYIHSNYTETIASNGYVVVAPDHTGNTAVERVTESSDPTNLIALNRPQDVRVVIDEMLNPESAETTAFVASINPDQIAITGHSFGGFTTYAAASGFDNDLGAIDADPRIDAIIPLAPAVGGNDPANQLLSDERLAAIDIPALVIVGTNDQTTPIDPNVTRAWDLTASSPHFRVELVDAQHNTFTDLCAYLDFFPSLPEVSQAVIDAIEASATEGCSVGDMAIDRAQELTNTFAITFLDAIFDGSPMITPDAFEIPDDINFLVK